MRTLTPKQERFVLDYIETGNASAAYKLVYGNARTRAETASRNGFKLLQNNKIISRIDELRKAAAKIAILTQATVIKDLMAIKDKAMAPGSDGEMKRPETAIKALELLGRNLGMWKPDMQVGIQVNNGTRESFEDVLSKAIYISGGTPGWEAEKSRQIGAAYLAYQRGEVLPDPLVIGGLPDPFHVRGYVLETSGPIPEGTTITGPDHGFIAVPRKCETTEEWEALVSIPKE